MGGSQSREREEKRPSGPAESPRAAARAERARLEARLRAQGVVALRARLRRVDALILELARPVGREALESGEAQIASLVDIARVVTKIERIDVELEGLAKETARPDGLIASISQDLSRLADKVASRELEARRERLVCELGLALLASDPSEMIRRTPALAAVVKRHAEDVKRVDELFVQQGLCEEELSRRASEGRLERPPKELERLAQAAGEAVGTAGRAATDTLKGLGKRAARAAAREGGKAVVRLAKGAIGLGGDEAERPKAAKGEEVDVPGLIRDLARLRDDGLLSEEEFERKKRELLERL